MRKCLCSSLWAHSGEPQRQRGHHRAWTPWGGGTTTQNAPSWSHFRSEMMLSSDGCARWECSHQCRRVELWLSDTLPRVCIKPAEERVIAGQRSLDGRGAVELTGKCTNSQLQVPEGARIQVWKAHRVLHWGDRFITPQLPDTRQGHYRTWLQGEKSLQKDSVWLSQWIQWMEPKYILFRTAALLFLAEHLGVIAIRAQFAKLNRKKYCFLLECISDIVWNCNVIKNSIILFFSKRHSSKLTISTYKQLH